MYEAPVYMSCLYTMVENAGGINSAFEQTVQK